MMIMLVTAGACVQPLGRDTGGISQGSVAKAAPIWQPGDDIPGWEQYDYDCPFYVDSEVATVRLPTNWWYSLNFGERSDVGFQFRLTSCLTDCLDAPCVDPGGVPGGAPFVYFGISVYRQYRPPDVWERAGFYSPSGYAANLPTSYISDEGTSAILSACISRMRPDEVSGILYITYYAGTLPHKYYDEPLVQFPFDFAYDDHAAWDFNIDTSLDEYHTMSDYVITYAEEATYDATWDWASITDPDIRAAVYDRYTPYNWP